MWPDKNGRGFTELLVEQVSYHPPITAHIIEKKSKGLRLVRHNAQKISFSSTYIRNFTSFCMFIFPSQRAHSSSKKSDSLPFPFPPTIALPCLRIDGRSPYIKLAETSYINGGGLGSLIEYKGKSYFFDNSHNFKTTVTPMPGMGSQGRGTVIDGTCTRRATLLKAEVEAP